MKNTIHNNFLISLFSKSAFVILGGIILISCGAQMEGYTETDGIYYDPKTDKIEQKIAWQEPRREREYYNHEESIIGQAQKNQKEQNQKYNNKNWGNNTKIKTSSSDWGTYTGVQNNYYYNNYLSWSNPYYNDFYSPYYFGYYNSYFGNYWNSGFNLGFSWGIPYYYSYYNPYWGYSGYYNYYNPWSYSNYYYPSYYYRYNNYYHPYYHQSHYPVKNYRRTSPDTVYRGSNRNSSHNYPNNSGFNRNSNWGNRSNSTINSTPIQRQNPNTWNHSTSPSNGGFRTSGNNGSSNGGFGRQSNWGNNGSSNNSNNSSGGFRR